jgi:hypothetical protein
MAIGDFQPGELDIALGTIPDAEEKALAALRAHREAMGMAWDGTPVPEADPWPVTGDEG